MVSKSKGRQGARSLPIAGVGLAADACPVCGTMMGEECGTLGVPVNGEEIAVQDAGHLKCPKCHEVVLRLDEARQLQMSALEAYRRKYGLLSAGEIRAIRERYGLTQDVLAQFLRLGRNTISRWESNRNVQSAAMDVLLRLIRDVPENLDYLRESAA